MFQFTPKLILLNLNGTKVTGNVSVLQGNNNLIEINLWKTRCFGNMSSFFEKKKLKKLVLAHSQVQGSHLDLKAALPRCQVIT